MDRMAQLGSSAFLNPDDGDSQSLSQARPRPAIRLDASLSFLRGGSSRTGSPLSGLASPAQEPLSIQSTTNPSSPALFTTRDVNLADPHGVHKSHSTHCCRGVSGSSLATSLSLSLGSSRHCSQQRRPPPPPPSFSTSSRASPRAEAAAVVEGDDEARCVHGFDQAMTVFDAAPESEATVLTQPSGSPPCESNGYNCYGANHTEIVERRERNSLPSQRAMSPAPRMAVTLPDDFDGDFDVSCSGRTTAVCIADAIKDVDQEDVFRTGSEPQHQGATADRSDIFPNVSSFSFRVPSKRNHRDGEERRSNDEEGSGDSVCSRTWSTTPPPRRAFVLSRRCSAASISASAVGGEKAVTVKVSEGMSGGFNTVVNESDDSGNSRKTKQQLGAKDKTEHTLTRNEEEAVTEEENGEARLGAVKESDAPRRSAVLVMAGGGSNEGDDAQPSFFAWTCIGERERRRRYGDRRRSAADTNEEAKVDAPKQALKCPHAIHEKKHCLEQNRTTVSRLDSTLPPAPHDLGGAAEEESGAANAFSADIISNEQRNTVASTQDYKNETIVDPLPPSSIVARGSTLLRLSDCVSGSSRSSMMSPLPRPVPSCHTHGTGIAAAVLFRQQNTSPAHSREDDDAEEVVEEKTGEAREDATAIGKSGTTANKTVDEEVNHPVRRKNAALQDVTGAAPRDKRSPSTTCHTPNTNATRTTTNITVSTAMSSLWLVSGPTPTPLRRLRGDEDVSESTEDAKAVPHREAFPTTETKAEKRVEEEINENIHIEDDENTLKTARSNSLKNATPSPRSAALSLTSDGGDEQTNEKTVKSTLEIETVGKTSNYQLQQQRLQRCVRDSCSPEPQRPESPQQSGAAASLTASISPVPERDQQARRHQNHRLLDVREACAMSETEAVPHTFTHTPRVFTAAPPLADTQMELELMQPSLSPSNTPRRVSHENRTVNVSVVAHEAATPPQIETSSADPSPSTTLSESARVSEEVRELVERAQAEVRRTRASLLATLREHRADFNLNADDDAEKNKNKNQSNVVTRAAALTPTRSLHFPPVTTTHTTNTSAADSPSLKTIPLVALHNTPSGATGRSSGKVRAAATALRPQLAAAADAILRRLQGYDERDHGVLPMETVVRVTYFVLTRRRMSACSGTLRTPMGGVASTPLRAAMAQHHQTTRHIDGWMGGTPCDREELSASALKAHTAPCSQRLSGNTSILLTSVENTNRLMPTSLVVGSECCGVKHGRCVDSTFFTIDSTAVTTTPKTAITAAGVVGSAVDTSGRSSTITSPSRTLEQVMAHQERRAEEESYLNFYFTVLEAFKQVFGERYAWRHLGATNASRHDNAVKKRARLEHSTETPMRQKHSDNDSTMEKTVPIDASAELEITNELNDVTVPLETVFPRLRQWYALRQCDGKPTAATGVAQRPPPLDVLVYYRTFTDSLREL